jgi:hypothetical protein
VMNLVVPLTRNKNSYATFLSFFCVVAIDVLRNVNTKNQLITTIILMLSLASSIHWFQASLTPFYKESYIHTCAASLDANLIFARSFLTSTSQCA